MFNVNDTYKTRGRDVIGHATHHADYELLCENLVYSWWDYFLIFAFPILWIFLV